MADINPANDYKARKLEHYWTRGAGLAKWADTARQHHPHHHNRHDRHPHRGSTQQQSHHPRRTRRRSRGRTRTRRPTTMTDTQQLTTAYTTIETLAPRLTSMKQPTTGNLTNAYTPPAPPHPRPPCNLTWVDYEWQLEGLLRLTIAQVRRDTGNLHGTPTPGLTGMARWLRNTADHISKSPWANNPQWYADQYQCEPTTDTLNNVTISQAHQLNDILEPPLNGRPAGTALEVSWETGIPVETIRTWGKRGKIPRFIGEHGAWLYRIRDIEIAINR